jgi:hypothetical protein
MKKNKIILFALFTIINSAFVKASNINKIENLLNQESKIDVKVNDCLLNGTFKNFNEIQKMYELAKEKGSKINRDNLIGDFRVREKCITKINNVISKIHSNDIKEFRNTELSNIETIKKTKFFYKKITGNDYQGKVTLNLLIDNLKNINKQASIYILKEELKNFKEKYKKDMCVRENRGERMHPFEVIPLRRFMNDYFTSQMDKKCIYSLNNTQVLQVLDNGVLLKSPDPNDRKNIFLYTDKDYVDGDIVSGFAYYKDNYKYQSLTGQRTVWAFEEINLDLKDYYFIRP